jgi:hypothetical protein
VSLILKEVHVFENGVLISVIGLEEEEVTGGLRKLHNVKPHNFYSSNAIEASKTRSMRWAGYVSRTGEIINAYKILVRNPEGKESLRELR